jgi:predicted ribonuclease YlaK
VYIAAPTQEQKQGYLKGTIEEKSEPYFEPFYQALQKIGVNLNTAFLDSAMNEKYQTGYIECLTHTFLRGTNFEGKVVIIDEAQNFYFDELMKVLTRIHDDCKVIVIGHDGQNDLLSNPERSGFVPYQEWFRADDRCAVCSLEKNYRGWISQHADQLTLRKAQIN